MVSDAVGDDWSDGTLSNQSFTDDVDQEGRKRGQVDGPVAKLLALQTRGPEFQLLLKRDGKKNISKHKKYST